jgi:hypothetical protein
LTHSAGPTIQHELDDVQPSEDRFEHNQTEDDREKRQLDTSKAVETIKLNSADLIPEAHASVAQPAVFHFTSFHPFIFRAETVAAERISKYSTRLKMLPRFTPLLTVCCPH